MEVDLTVAICTLNRSKLLEKCLEVRATQDCAPCTPKSIVEQARGELPKLRYIHEPRRGVTIARNSAVQASRGRYLAFADDACVLCSCWCHSICQIFSRLAAQNGCQYAALCRRVDADF